MIDLTDGLLNAFLDGELDPETEAKVVAALRENPGARLRVERMRDLNANMRAAYPLSSPDAEDVLAERILTEPAPFQERVERKAIVWAGLSALAAGLIGVVIGQQEFIKPLEAPASAIMTLDGLAQDALSANASGAIDAKTQITVSFTFKTEEGRYCRQFYAPEGEGIACLQEGMWRLAAWDAAGARTNHSYQAAGASSLIDEAADRLDAAPLDAAAEGAVIQRGWR